MGFTGETGCRGLFETRLPCDEMLSRQNWGKFKEFLRTWPMIFSNIFSLLPPSSQMLWGWQWATSPASSQQGTRTTPSQGVKQVSPLASLVDTGKGKTFSAHLHHTPHAGASVCTSHPSVPSCYLSTPLSFKAIEIRKDSETTSPRNKRTEEQEQSPE